MSQSPLDVALPLAGGRAFAEPAKAEYWNECDRTELRGEAMMSVGFHPSTQPTRSGDHIKLKDTRRSPNQHICT